MRNVRYPKTLHPALTSLILITSPLSFVASATTFEDWSIDNNIAFSTLADDDGDTVPNLLEYAFNGDPKDPNNQGFQPSYIYTNNTIRYTYKRRSDNPDIYYTIESSESLDPNTWSPVGKIISTQRGNTYDTVTEEIALDGTSSFFRLAVQLEDLPSLIIPITLEGENTSDRSSSLEVRTINTEGESGEQSLSSLKWDTWAEYTVNVAEAGMSRIGLRVSSSRSAEEVGGKVDVYLSGKYLTTIEFPGTGSTDNWQTIEQLLYIPVSGEHTVRLDVRSGNFRLNWFQIEPVLDYGRRALASPLEGFIHLSQSAQNIPIATSGTSPYGDNPVYENGGYTFDNDRVEILSSEEADQLFDITGEYGPNDRKAGMGFAVAIAYRASETFVNNLKMLVSNGNKTSHGFSIALGHTHKLYVSKGGNKWLTDESSPIQPNQFFVVVANYNAVMNKLEFYSTHIDEFRSITTEPLDYATGRALLLGGYHETNRDGNGTFYEVRVYDRTLSRIQMKEEAEALDSKWAPRASLIQHLKAETRNDFELNGDVVRTWLDSSGNDNHASAEEKAVLYAPYEETIHKTVGAEFRGDNATLKSFNASEQDAFLDFSATGAANGKSGMTVVLAFNPQAPVSAWNDIFGHYSSFSQGLTLRTSSSLQPIATMGGADMRANTNLIAGQPAVFTLRYDSAASEVQFWNSHNQQVLSRTLAPADFSNSHPMRLGRAENPGRYFDGDIYELKIFESALSDEALAHQQELAMRKWAPAVMPVEVLGHEGIIEERYVYLDKEAASKAMDLWLQVNNLTYENKASVKINDSPWMDINHETVGMPDPELLRGGMTHGGYNTIRLAFQSVDFIEGLNRIQFRFNESDGIAMGYRVVAMDILDFHGYSLLPDSQFVEDDPAEWTGFHTDQASIDEGRNLWYGVTAWPPTASNKVPAEDRLITHYKAEGVEGFWYGYALPEVGTILASCTDCHTHDGRDLEIFAYSNRSIVERAKFHGMSEDQGEKIASYIRTLADQYDSVERAGRPWNPPYQPGPSVADLPIHNWAAGAGLDAVLEEDSEMVPFLFNVEPGENPTQQQVNDFFNTGGTFDSTTLPLALQFPDWKHWLPMVHPMDAFNGDLWDNGIERINPNHEPRHPKQRLEEARAFLETMPAGEAESAAFMDANFETFHDYVSEVRAAFRFWWEAGPDTIKRSHWRSFGGTAVNNLKPEIPREFASQSLAKLQGVKGFELQNEFGLQGMQYRMADEQERLDYSIPERSWLTKNTYHVYPIAPHFIADGQDGLEYRGQDIPSNSVNFLGQTEATGQNESTTWYELQAVLTPGNKTGHVRGPVHYNYQMSLISGFGSRSKVRQGMRWMMNANRMYQTLLGGKRMENRVWGWSNSWEGLTDDSNEQTWHGFELRNMQPDYLFTQGGDMLRSADAVYPGLGDKIAQAHLQQYIDEIGFDEGETNALYPLDQWPRQSEFLPEYGTEFKNHMIDDVNVGTFEPNSEVDFAWSDDFYLMLLRAAKTGVDTPILEKIKRWGQAAWPDMPWADLEFAPKAEFTGLNLAESVAPKASFNVDYTFTNTGDTPWTAADTFTLALNEHSGFKTDDGLFEIYPRDGAYLIGSWSRSRTTTTSHHFTLAPHDNPARVSIQLATRASKTNLNFDDGSIVLLSGGVEIAELTGSQDTSVNDYVEWTAEISDQDTSKTYEIIIQLPGYGDYLFVDEFKVTESVTGTELYADNVESTEYWPTSTGSDFWEIDHTGPATAIGRISLPAGVVVAPNESYTFTSPLTAPPVEGSYDLTVQLHKEGFGWFGPEIDATVQVVPEW
ncbi:MAG: carbohydrate-binding protein [Opitutales bacterium]